MKINTNDTYSGWQTWRMNINRDTHYLFRVRNMEDEVNTDTHYLFRMTTK